MSGPAPIPTPEQKREPTAGQPAADATTQGGNQASSKKGFFGLFGLNYQAGVNALTDWNLFAVGGALDKQRTPGSQSTSREGAEAKTRDADGEAELKHAIGEQAAKRKSTPDAGVVDAKAAFEKAKAWTLAQRSSGDNRAKVVERELIAEHEAAEAAWNEWVTQGKPPMPRGERAPKDPGTKDAFIQSRWVSAYWFKRCYQFAAKVQSFLTGPKKPMMRLVDETALAAKEGKADEIVGRTTHYRGMTLAEVGAAELANLKLAPGTSIHVKLHFEGDVPYEYKDDFHHWVVYVGEGKFSDTLTGQDKAGAAHDRVLQGWVNRGFKGQAFKAFHRDPRFVSNPNASKVVPRSGLQPLVTAEYDPRMSVTRKEG